MRQGLSQFLFLQRLCLVQTRLQAATQHRQYQQNHYFFISKSIEKQTAPQESTAQLLLLNGHTLEFHPQTQKLEPPCTAQ